MSKKKYVRPKEVTVEEAILQHMLAIRQIITAADPGETLLCLNLHLGVGSKDAIVFYGSPDNPNRLDFYREFDPIPVAEEEV